MMVCNLGLRVGSRSDTCWLALSHRLSGLRKTLKVELVGVSLAVHLLHDVLVVVVSQSARKFVIVHVRFALPFAPFASNLVGIQQLELSVSAFPGDAGRVGLIGEQLEQELPQLDLARAAVDGSQMMVSMGVQVSVMRLVLVRRTLVLLMLAVMLLVMVMMM